MSRAHAAGHFESMDETIAMLALGESDQLVTLTGMNELIVDPVSGNDATGSINGTPIKTIAKLNEIVNGTFFSNGSLTVRLLSSPPITDAELNLTIRYENAPINSDLPFGVGASPFLMLGSITNVAYSGTLATVVPVTYVPPPGTPTRETVTDPGVPNWAVFEFQPLIPTSGDVGFFAWVAPPGPVLTNGFTTAPTDLGGFPAKLSVGDNYVIVNQVQVKLGQITLIGDGTGLAEFHDLYFIDWQNNATFQNPCAVINNFDSLSFTGVGSLGFGRCRFDIPVTGAGQTCFFASCCLTLNPAKANDAGVFGGSWFIIAGYFNPENNTANIIILSSNYISGDGPLGVNPGTLINVFAFPQEPIHGIFDQGLQFWGWHSAALTIFGATMVTQTPLFGRSAKPATIGAQISGGGKLILLHQLGGPPVPPPNLVGTGSFLPGSNGTDTDFTIDDLLNAAHDPVSRSWQEGPAAYTPQIHNSWANFLVAQPAGFDANPADPTSIGNAQSAATGSLIANAFLV